MVESCNIVDLDAEFFQRIGNRGGYADGGIGECTVEVEEYVFLFFHILPQQKGGAPSEAPPV